jgi:hypothetical protein
MVLHQSVVGPHGIALLQHFLPVLPGVVVHERQENPDVDGGASRAGTIIIERRRRLHRDHILDAGLVHVVGLLLDRGIEIRAVPDFISAVVV